MYRLKQIILTLGDLILLYVGLYAALAIRYQELPTTQLYAILGPMNLLLLFSPVILFISGAYDLVKIKNTWNFYKKILVSALVWLVTGVLYFYLNPDLKIAPKTILLLTTIVGFSLIALWRYFHSRYVAQIIKKTTAADPYMYFSSSAYVS
jgi:FlaA1/EpsC-like NDP-sugar epimerase